MASHESREVLENRDCVAANSKRRRIRQGSSTIEGPALPPSEPSDSSTCQCANAGIICKNCHPNERQVLDAAIINCTQLMTACKEYAEAKMRIEVLEKGFEGQLHRLAQANAFLKMIMDVSEGDKRDGLKDARSALRSAAVLERDDFMDNLALYLKHLKDLAN